jgi:hypothetical protein
MPVLQLLLFLGEEVCLILCDPTAADVVDLLDSLAAIAARDAPANLSALALNCLKPNTDPPSSTYVVQYRNEKAAGIPVKIENSGTIQCGKENSTIMVQHENETSDSVQYKKDNSITFKHDLEKSTFIQSESKNTGTSTLSSQQVDNSVAVLKNQQQKHNAVSIFGADKPDSIQQQQDESGSSFETKKFTTSQPKEAENSISTGIQQRTKQTASDAISDAVPVVKDDPVEEAISSLWCNKDELVTSDDFRMAELFKKRTTKIKLKRMGVSNKSVKVGSPLGGKRSKGPAAFSSGSSSSKTSRRDRSRPLVSPSYIFNHITEADEVASIKVEISPSDIILPTSGKDDGGFNDGANPASDMDAECGTGTGKSRTETVKNEDADDSDQEGLEASDSNPEVQVPIICNFEPVWDTKLPVPYR